MTKEMPRPRAQGSAAILASLYVLEGAVLLAAVALHKGGDRALGDWLLTAPGLALAVASLVSVAVLGILVRQYLRQRASGQSVFALVVAMNMVTLLFILVPLEIALRALSERNADSRALGGRTLLPRSWEQAASHNLRIFTKASGDLTYLVYDDTLGWTVGPSRRNATGMYLSAAEGLRAATQGEVLSGAKTRRRVALVGDSFVFAERVRFEDSWGHLLESGSGGKLQVLNFGVGGYGVDQAYLRFRKEVLAWKPDVVILGFPLADLHRSMTVYPFIDWPEWDMPFSKPRLIRDKGVLRPLNVPSLPPPEVFGRRSIDQLPFLEFDVGYRRHEWEWGIFDALLGKRWLFSFFPRWVERNPNVSDEELIEVNRAILLEFMSLANAHGVKPLIVYFPGKPEMLRRKRGEMADGQRIMKEIGVPFLDAGPCLMKLDPETAYVVDDPHYSPPGNAAVAGCVAGALGS
jgi:hypothetical protein